MASLALDLVSAYFNHKNRISSFKRKRQRIQQNIYLVGRQNSHTSTGITS